MRYCISLVAPEQGQQITVSWYSPHHLVDSIVKTKAPLTYQWQVLPFSTSTSPCCAIHSLQSYVKEYLQSEKALQIQSSNPFM